MAAELGASLEVSDIKSIFDRLMAAEAITNRYHSLIANSIADMWGRIILMQKKVSNHVFSSNDKT